MKTIVDGNLVLVDGVIAVEKDRGKYKTYVANDKFKDAVVFDTKTDQPINLAAVTPPGRLEKKPIVEYDKKHYNGGMNGLTVEESVERAYSKIVRDIFNGDRSYGKVVKEGIRYLIKHGYGRDAAYKLAAQATKACKEGYYGKTNRMVVFSMAAQNNISQPSYVMKYEEPSFINEFGAPIKKPEPVQYDPMYYYGGNNGLTLEKSAERATNEVIEILGYFATTGVPKHRELIYEGTYEIIKDGKGRQAAYKLAGDVKKNKINGSYNGVPLPVVFNAKARGIMA